MCCIFHHAAFFCRTERDTHYQMCSTNVFLLFKHVICPILFLSPFYRWENSGTERLSRCTIYIPIYSEWECLFLYLIVDVTTLLILCLYEKWKLYFILICNDWIISEVELLFTFVRHLCFFFGLSVHISCPFFYWGFCLICKSPLYS